MQTCYAIGCMSSPRMFCNCTSPPIFICQTHFMDHFLNKTPACDSFPITYVKVNHQTKVNVVSYLKILKSNINHSKVSFRAQSADLIKLIDENTQAILSKFVNLEKQVSSMIKYSIITDEISDVASSQLEICLSKSNNDLNNYLPYWEPPSFDEKFSQILGQLNFYFGTQIKFGHHDELQQTNLSFEFSKSEIPKMLSVDNLQSTSNSSLFFYNSQLKKVITICVKDNEITDNPNELNDIISHGVSQLKLPDGLIFCYGDLGPQNLGSAFIIDKSFQITQCPPGLPCRWASLTYLYDEIFAIGGLKDDKLKLTTFSKFNISQKK